MTPFLKQGEHTGWRRRDFLQGAGAAIVTGLAPSIVRARTRDAGRPNIVLIMVDDMGFSDLGCYGSEIPTPNIDSLAASGVRFTQFYNGAVCCPTRASLLTGLYPHQAGMGWWTLDSAPVARPSAAYRGMLGNDCVTLAEVLRTAGYRTLMSGKWHVGAQDGHWPTDRGFERYFGLLVGAANYFEPDRGGRRLPGTGRMALDDKPYHPPTKGFYLTDAITDYAVEFLDREGRGTDPFFLYTAYTAPHCPLHALPEDIARHRGRYLAGWDKVRAARYERMRQMGVIDSDTPLSPRDSGVHPWAEGKDPDLMDLKMAIYAAQIDRMDRGVGRILDKLRALGKFDNTLVVFLSDNGACAVPKISHLPEKFNRPPYLGGPQSSDIYGRAWANVSNTPLRRFKYWMEEGGISTPMIASWPGHIRRAGEFSHHVGHVMDFMVTFVEIGEAEYPRTYNGNAIQSLEGKSLMAAFRGKAKPREGPLCWEFEGDRAVRQGPWKLVGDREGSWELFNVEHDRTESRNLAYERPAQVNHLQVAYAQWAERCGVRSWHELGPLFNLPHWGEGGDE